MKLWLQAAINIDVSYGGLWRSLRGRMNNRTQKIHGTNNHALSSSGKIEEGVSIDAPLALMSRGSDSSCSILSSMCSVLPGSAAFELGSRHL